MSLPRPSYLLQNFPNRTIYEANHYLERSFISGNSVMGNRPEKQQSNILVPVNKAKIENVNHQVDTVTLTTNRASSLWVQDLTHAKSQLAYAQARGDQSSVTTLKQKIQNIQNVQNTKSVKKVSVEQAASVIGKPLSMTVASAQAVDGGSGYLPDDQLPSDIQNEIKHLQDMYNATDDKVSQDTIHATADMLREIGTTGHSYEVIHSNAFIPPATVTDPRFWLSDTFHGDGRISSDGSTPIFDPNSLAVRTSQVVVVDLNAKTAVNANFVGKTIEYDKNGNVEAQKRASTDGMHMSVNQPDDSTMRIIMSEDSSNPLVDGAPGIQYTEQYDINTSTGHADVWINDSKFPSYELYMKGDGGDFQALQQFVPDLNPTIMGVPVPAAGQLFRPFFGSNNVETSFDLNSGAQYEVDHQLTHYEAAAPMSPQKVEMIEKQMADNASKWTDASPDQRIQLHNANEQLGQSIGAAYNSTTGVWTLPTQQTTTPVTNVDLIKQQMADNAAKWATTSSQTEKQQLHDTNLQLGKSIGGNYNPTTGTWNFTSTTSPSMNPSPSSVVNVPVVNVTQAASAYRQTTTNYNLGSTVNNVSRPTQVSTADQIKQQMAANSAAWGAASPAEKQRLHDENVKLAQSIGGVFDSNSGNWSFH